MNTAVDVRSILDEALGMHGRASTLADDAPLLGAIPELDSIAVVAIITMLEERFGFVVEDDEIDAAAFETLAALVEFVARKLSD